VVARGQECAVTPVEVYDDALATLGARDQVRAREAVKRQAVALAERLRIELAAVRASGQTDPDWRDGILEAVSGPCEEFLAAVLPLVEYGDHNDHAAVAQALQHVVDHTHGDRSFQRVPRLSAVVVYGRLTWSIATYALAARRLDALVALAGVEAAPESDWQAVGSILDDRTIRYPDALGGNAGASYTDYSQWLSGLGLVQARLPYLHAALPTVFDEADLLLALHMQAASAGRTYSGGKRSHAISRLAARFRQPQQRAPLAAFFDVDEDALNEHVEQAYAEVEYDRDYPSWDVPARMLT
jgi:hypothetical protein